MSICMKKISPVRAELFHADGQTDVTMLIVALNNFANAPKNQVYQIAARRTIYYGQRACS